MKEKFTRTDIIKIINVAGIERAKAGGIALAIVAAMADALTAGKVIERIIIFSHEPGQKETA